MLRFKLVTLLIIITIISIFFAFKSPNRKPNIFKLSCEFSSGHPSSACGGVGEICSYGVGSFFPCHIPCVGSGSDCKWKVEIGFLVKANDSYQAEDVVMTFLESSPGTYFKMPNRSVLSGLGGNQAYMNIPDQVIMSPNQENLTNVPLSSVTFSATPFYSNID